MLYFANSIIASGLDTTGSIAAAAARMLKMEGPPQAPVWLDFILPDGDPVGTIYVVGGIDPTRVVRLIPTLVESTDTNITHTAGQKNIALANPADGANVIVLVEKPPPFLGFEYVVGSAGHATNGMDVHAQSYRPLQPAA